jgi:hypothetical protein
MSYTNDITLASDGSLQAQPGMIEYHNGLIYLTDNNGTKTTTDFLSGIAPTTDLTINSLNISTTGTSQVVLTDVSNGNKYGLCISAGTIILTTI